MSNDSLFYLENPLACLLQNFNDTEFAKEFSFEARLAERGEVPGWSRWIYHDFGGALHVDP
jgi:hypothetical protein